MKELDVGCALEVAIDAARKAGALMQKNFRSRKKVNAATQHDIKLELDVRCQKLIERRLAAAFPTIPVLGEEGETGDSQAKQRWVVDPIDGTVNFAYGIPHACVAIALQQRVDGGLETRAGEFVTPDGYATLLGVVYDPFVDELWTARRGGRARLNGRPISVSTRHKLNESIISIGFAKREDTLDQMLPALNQLLHRVRKIRIMGSAALALTYVASGRTEAYLETGIRLWDIAAGGLILECAGGDFRCGAVRGEYHTYRLVASNGLVRKPLAKIVSW